MGARWNRLKQATAEAIESAATPTPVDYPFGQPRELTPEDRAGWNDALDRRASMKPQTVESVRALIRQRNPIRWRQLQNDIKWVEKEMKKLGLNPEDARSIL